MAKIACRTREPLGRAGKVEWPCCDQKVALANFPRVCRMDAVAAVAVVVEYGDGDVRTIKGPAGTSARGVSTGFASLLGRGDSSTAA